MKKIKVKSLNEASGLTPEDKMRLFNTGARRENVKACSDQKLKDYYKICAANGFRIAGAQILQELIARGLLSTEKPNLDSITLEESDILNEHAEEVFNNLDKLIADLTTTNRDLVSDNSLNDRQAIQIMVNYILYLIWAIVLKVEKSKLDKLMQLCVNFPAAKIDEQQIKRCIKKVIGNKEIVDKINKIANAITTKENLDEAIEKHNQLNPKLWTEDKLLKDEVREKILEVVDKFLEQLEEDEIKIDVEDIKIVGSNCSYNYTKDSDLDIHIVSNTSKLNNKDNLYPVIYDKYRSLFNNKYDIEFYDIPVEIYVETSDTVLEEERKASALKSNGIYSVLNNKWIKEPVLEDIPDVDEELIEKEFNEWVDKIDKINASKSVEEIEKFFEELYDMRRASIAKDGEYGIGNLVFKELRNNLYLDDLKDLKNDLVSAELSLTK